MISSSARCNAGHFFTMVFLLVLWAGCGNSNSEMKQADTALPSADVLMLLTFSHSGNDGDLAGVTDSLAFTASGFIHESSHQEGNPGERIAARADSAGKLILVITGEEFTIPGSREHLAVSLGENGIPRYSQLDPAASLPPDSLWPNPLTRQEAVRALTDFFKPDLVIQELGETDNIGEILAYWDHCAEESGITVATIEKGAATDTGRRWASFSGSSVRPAYINGLRRENFYATVYMLMEIDWTEGGYPALEAFHTERGSE